MTLLNKALTIAGSDTSGGAGCTFSAAITAGLANGMEMRDAVLQAKKFVTAALKHGFAINNIVGCTNHTAFKKYGA